MILDKELLKSKRDQLVECLPIREARLSQIGELEDRLEITKQEKIVHSQEVTQLHVELAKLMIKWAELQKAVNSVVEREFASIERINNLEANLRSKTKEAIVAKEKSELMEERLRKVMEQNREHSKTNTNLSRAYNILKVDNE